MPSANPDIRRKIQARYYKKNREKAVEARRKWRSQNSERIRRYKVEGGIPYEPTSECECCKKPLTAPKLDHCHLTGIFRGWLCHSCNIGIGLLGDSPDGIKAALEYLNRAYTRIRQA
jgi:hypothetical protein